MDDPDLDRAEHAMALQGLARINLVTCSTRMLWRNILTLSQETEKPLSVLDVACGGGDVLLTLAKKGQAAGCNMKWIACDLSPTAIETTASHFEAAQLPVETHIQNALEPDHSLQADVVFCSLFLHHLSEDQAIELLKSMASRAERLVLVSDLRRSRWGYQLAWWGTRLLSRSKIVHVDGPRSVEAAYTEQEVHSLAQQAGLENETVTRFWPERFLLKWKVSV
ncbi:methyltransferase domain-containing protein [Rubinisphaera italica]|uniref:Methyltransferase domain-containing protein n=1 Tax=Rubinisphaera italica TaxID=2527969 RepID=A0A5C5XF13_9PLAN|nr:methyltransferase domain-containing protein [Rubinisphaera italica]TWT60482.1 hypothetical protein Pan54_11960 [Rubinisphaera italica]